MPCDLKRAIVLLSVGVLSTPVAMPPARLATPAGGEFLPLQSDRPLAVLREHRYRMAAGVRPLLLFWITRDNVGGARIVWRHGESGERGYEILIGSDPRRAPRGINRWGYVREHSETQVTTLVGVMKQADEQSIEEAKAKLAKEGRDGYFFKMIRQSVGTGEATSEVITLRAPLDFSYRELEALLRAFDSGQGISKTRRVTLAPATRPGFMCAVAELVHESVETARRPTSGRRAQSTRTIPFIFNATSYDLTLRSSEYLETARFGDRNFTRLVRNQFETLNRETRTREQFTLVCGLDGAYAEVPVFISYQPRWWFRADLVIDDSVVF